VAALTATVGLVAIGSASQASQKPSQPRATTKLTFGYVSPGPDTWYARDVQGFEYAAKLYGVKVDVLNSEYDQQKELANIESFVAKGVNGISMFSYDDTGADETAVLAGQAHIPVVLTDNVHNAISNGYKVAASVDFDWCGMGKDYANYMAKEWPGQNYAMLAGNFLAPPTVVLDSCMQSQAKKLGKNKLVYFQQTMYDTETAVNLSEDLIASGTKFGILFVMNDDMGAAVSQVLKSHGLLKKVHLMTENGSNVGLALMKQGKLAYTISSSPAWEGMVAFLELYAAAQHRLSATADKEVLLPAIPVTRSVALNPMKVVSWTPGPVDWTLTKDYLPGLVVKA
jgi:ribose transport system substrate-binding protein